MLPRAGLSVRPSRLRKCIVLSWLFFENIFRKATLLCHCLLWRWCTGIGRAGSEGRAPRRRNVGGGGPEVLLEENYRPNFTRPTSPGRALGSGAAGAARRLVEVEISLAEAVLADFLVATLEFLGLQDTSPRYTLT